MNCHKNIAEVSRDYRDTSKAFYDEQIQNYTAVGWDQATSLTREN
jgi:hypothetical protein